MDPNDAQEPAKGRISRRTFVAGVGLGAVGAAIAACVPGGANPTTAPASPTDAASAAPSAAPSENTLPDLTGQAGVLWGLKYDPHIRAYERMVAAFNAKTGAKMTVEPIDPDLAPKFVAALAAGTQPDVMCYYAPVMQGLLIQQVCMPITASVYEANGVDPDVDFIGDSMGGWRYEGEIFGVPVESNAVGHIVNVPVDEVEALGTDAVNTYPPTSGETYFESYESMWELAKLLQKEDGGAVTRWGISSKPFELEGILGIMRSLGTDWWDPATKQFHIDNDAGIKAIQLLAETPVKMGIETELDQGAIDAALAGKVALARGQGVDVESATELGYKYELAGAPKVVPGEDPLFVGGGGWGFLAPKAAKNPELSIAFLRFVATYEGQLEFAKIYNGLLQYAWAGFADDMSRFADPSPDNAVVRASQWYTKLNSRVAYLGDGFGYFLECQNAAGAVCSEVRQGRMTAAQAAAELQTRLEAQYAQYVKDVAKYA